MKTYDESELLSRIKHRTLKETIEVLAEGCEKRKGKFLVFSNGIPRPFLIEMMEHHMIGDVGYMFRKRHGVVGDLEEAGAQFAISKLKLLVGVDSLELDVVEDSRWETLFEPDSDNGIALLENDAEVIVIDRPLQKVFNVLADECFNEASSERLSIVIDTLAEMQEPRREGLYFYPEFEYETLVSDYLRRPEILKRLKLTCRGKELLQSIIGRSKFFFREIYH